MMMGTRSVMKRTVFSSLALALALVVPTVPVAAQDARTDVPLLGSGPLGFGVDVSSLKSGFGIASDRLSAVSFDLRLHWPVAGSNDPGDVVRRLEPFVTLGPALLVAPLSTDIPLYVDPHDPADTGLSLGVRGGAGLSIQLGKSTSLFGQYSLTHATGDRLLRAGGRSPLDPGLTAHDLLYGLSVRF
jgi:hypothetical protein